MSQDYEIGLSSWNWEQVVHEPAFENVEETAREIVQLADVLGKVPVKEMVEVLGSDWANQQGWQVVQQGKVFERTFAEGEVRLTLSVSELGQITVLRQASSRRVEAVEAATVRGEQIQLLNATRDICRLAVNELVVATMTQALPVRAGELGLKVTEQAVYQQQAMVSEIVLQVEVNF